MTTTRTESAPDQRRGAPTTGSRTTQLLGAACLAGIAVLLVFAFVFTEPDERVDEATNIITGQQDAVRLLYVHFPSILVAYSAFLLTAVGSVMVLWKRSTWWDITASASAEIGVLFCALTLITGSIWGRPIWNTWWEWGDARIMTTVIMFLIYVGYLAYRRVVIDPAVRAKRSAIIGLIGVVNIPIVNRSVEWWSNRTLHQKSTIAKLQIEDLTLFTLVMGMVVFSAVYVWLMIHRFRIGWLEYQSDTAGLDHALAERRAQATADVEGAITHPSTRTEAGSS